MKYNVEEKKVILDISGLSGNVSKTFLYYLVSVFDCFSRNKHNIDFMESMLKRSMPEWDTIMQILDGRLCLLCDVVCLKDGHNQYQIENHFDLYNLGMALVNFKYMDENIKKISYANARSRRQDNYELFIRIQETVTMWNLGLTTVLWKNFGYKYSSKQGLAILGNGYLNEVLRLFRTKYSIYTEQFWSEIDNKEIADIMVFFYLLSKQEIDLKCNTLRMQYAQLAYMYSPFIEASRKKDIGILFDILWKIFYDCEIAKIYIEENEYKVQKEISDLGKKDRTTRIHVIFSLKNTDIYSLRIDMPHKGIGYAHINMQEVLGNTVADSAMPILDDAVLAEIKELLKEDINKFFYEVGEDIWWFRINFLKRLEQITDESVSQRLKFIFETHKHYEMKIETDGYELFNEFKHYLKLYMSDLVQTSYPLEIGEEISKYRCILWSRDMIEKLFVGVDTEEVIHNKINAYMKKIKDKMSEIILEFSREEINALTWQDVLEVLLGEFGI